MQPEGFALHIEGDYAAGQRLIPLGKQLVAETRRQKREGGLHLHTRAAFVKDGSYLYCTIIGDQARLRIVAGGGASSEYAVSTPGLPDFLSGVVTDPRVLDQPVNPPPGAVSYPQTVPMLQRFIPTPECERLYALNRLNKPGPQPSRRLAVPPHWTFWPASPGLSGGGFSQSGRQQDADYNTNLGGAAFGNLTGWLPYNPVSYGKESYAYGPALGAPYISTRWQVAQTIMPPTLWSGKMRALVQLLFGFGRLSQESIYGGRFWDAVETEDEEWRRSLADSRQTAHDREVASNGVQVPYDMRWFRTHGLTQAADGAWWIVQISGTGVMAMPLPLWEETTTAAFREKVEAKNDAMGRVALDEFGGFPTGERFQPGDPWVRAGRTLRLLSVSGVNPFYAGWSPFFVLCGWAFSPNGREAHNTHWQYGDTGAPLDTGHWAVTLDIGPTRSPDQTADVALQIAGIFFGQGLEAKYPAEFEPALWKIRYLSNAQIQQVLQAAGGVEGMFKVLAELQAVPLATGAAQLVNVSRGQIWTTLTPRGQPQFKFPDPDRACLASFDFNPAGRPVDWPARRMDCDATVWVGYIQGALEICKFSATVQDLEPEETSPDEECQYVGEWVWEGHSAGRQPQMFYTSRFDDRADVADNSHKTVITGRDVGYIRAGVQDRLFEPEYHDIFRERGFVKRVQGWFRNGASLAASVLIPFGDRQAYYYALYRGAEQEQEWAGEWIESLVDPNGGVGGRAYLGRNPAWRCDAEPATGRIGIRYVVEPTYAPYPCSEYADNGAWVSQCQPSDGLAFTSVPPVDPGFSTPARPLANTRVWFVSDYPECPILVKDWTAEGSAAGFPNAWFALSPTDDFQAYLETTQNVLGDRPLLFYFAEMNAMPTTRGSLLDPEMRNQRFACVGVVD